MKYYYFATTFVLLFLYSCNGTNPIENPSLDHVYSYSVFLDNALDTTAYVFISQKGVNNVNSFDTTAYEIEGGDLKKITLLKLEYNVLVKNINDSIILDEDITLDGGALEYNLNLTKEDYIKTKFYYTDINENEVLNNSKQFSYNGEIYEDDAIVIKGDLLVPVSWDYNIDVEAPDTITTKGNQKVYRTQLNRAKEYVLYMELFNLFNSWDIDDID